MVLAYFYAFKYATRREYALYALGAFSAALSGAAFPCLDLVYGIWLQTFATTYPDFDDIRRTAKWTALTCLGIGLSQILTSFLFFTCFSLAATKLSERLRRTYLDSLVYQDAVYFEKVGAGEAAMRIVKDISLVKSAIGEKLGFIVWGLSTLIAATVMAFIKAPRLAGVLFAILPVGGIFFSVVGFFVGKYSTIAGDLEGQASTFLEQILSSIRVVQAFAAENVLTRKYDAYLQKLQANGFYKSLYKGLELAIAFGMLFLVYCTAFWFGSIEVVNGLAVGDMFTAFWNFFNALYAIANILPHIAAVLESIPIQAKLQEEINRIPGINVRDESGLTFSADENWETSIELRNVTFTYPSRPDQKSLNNVNMKIPAQRTTAIVGASGSGKSTIASLLMRYYDLPPKSETSSVTEKDDGRVLLAGQDLHSYQLKWLRSQIAIVTQEPQLFTTSIFDNVAFGLTGTEWEYDPETSDEKQTSVIRGLVQEALEKAQAWTFVSNLPHGMDTKVSGARTGVLSGGQRQRIAVARALIRRPKILVLDEGTSALDAEVESRLMKVVHAEQKSHAMTTILIAHRLSTIQAADNIIVMSEGRVVEEGNYSQLIAAEGVFHALVANQMMNPSSGSHSKTPDTHSAPKITHSDVIPLQVVTSRQSNLTPKHPEFPHHSASQLEKGDVQSEEIILPQKDYGMRYLGYVNQFKMWTLGGTLLAMAVGAAFPVTAWLVGEVVETFSIVGDNGRLRSEANSWSLWFLILAVGTVVVCVASGTLLEVGAERLNRRFRLNSLLGVIRQEISFFDMESNASGTLTALVTSHGTNASTVAGLMWTGIVATHVNLLGAVVLAFCLSWKLALVCFIPLPFVFAAAWLNIVLLERYEAELQKPLEEASGYVGENIDNIKTVAALGREKAVLGHFERRALSYEPPNMLLYKGAFGFAAGIGSVLMICAIIMAWGTRLFTNGELSRVGLFASMEAIIIANISSSRIFSFIPDVSRAVHSFKSITIWELREPKIRQLPKSKTSQGSPQISGEITFRNCTMKYVGRERAALTDVSITVKAGQTVAFCGPSGGGKSTILALINRFYDPVAGTIEVDGIDIQAIALDKYRTNLALVAQDAVLYEGTFRDNITLGATGDREVSQEELEKACADASVLEYIRSLPEGFDTSVGYKGLQMSGGQRQRVCIARALLRRPKILLLDEATSALDAESEKAVQQALETASKGRTTLVVAHRLSTIQNADVIYVVEDGRIVEHGSHNELVKMNGRYFDVSDKTGHLKPYKENFDTWFASYSL